MKIIFIWIHILVWRNMYAIFAVIIIFLNFVLHCYFFLFKTCSSRWLTFALLCIHFFLSSRNDKRSKEIYLYLYDNEIDTHCKIFSILTIRKILQSLFSWLFLSIWHFNCIPFQVADKNELIVVFHDLDDIIKCKFKFLHDRKCVIKLSERHEMKTDKILNW